MPPIDVPGLGVKILGSRPGTEFLGGTNTRSVAVVEAQSLPSLVYFEVLVPQAGYTAGLAKAAALGYASIFETILLLDNVVGVQWSQAPDANQELADIANIYVSSQSGDSVLPLSVPILKLGPGLHQPQINALSKQLTDSEAT